MGKAKPKLKEPKVAENPPEEKKEELEDNGHSIEDQKKVGYIVDMSDTEKQWNEKKEKENAEQSEPDKEALIKVK